MNRSDDARRPLRVVIIDDDDISRRGIASVLEDAGRIEVTAALSRAEATECSVRWNVVDRVVVTAADERREDDQFPGVQVVHDIRRRRCTQAPTVIVVTEHYYDDALRRRMQEVRADYFHDRAELRDGVTLRSVVLHPQRLSRPVPPCVDPETQFRYGVTHYSRVNRAVAFAGERDLINLLAARPEPRSRTWLRLRQEFNREARLTTVTSDGRMPDRIQDYPSLPQIYRFLIWATRIKHAPCRLEDVSGGPPRGGDQRRP